MNLLVKSCITLASNRTVSNTEIIEAILANCEVYFFRRFGFIRTYIVRLFETLENAICAELSRISADRLVSGS